MHTVVRNLVDYRVTFPDRMSSVLYDFSAHQCKGIMSVHRTLKLSSLMTLVLLGEGCGLTKPLYIKYEGGSTGTKTATEVIPSPDPSAQPKESDQVSFSTNLKPMLDGKCAFSGCHASGGTPPDLSTLEAAKTSASKSIDRVRGRGPVMPPTYSPKGALNEDQKKLLETWVTGGFLP